MKCVVEHLCSVRMDRDIHVYNRLNFRQRNVKLLLSMMTTVGKEMIELNFFFIDGTMGQHVKQTG